jgi:hypothetical protein
MAGGDQEEAVLGHGKRRGKGSCQTGFSPGTYQGGHLGRRRAGGGGFCSGELGTCEVNSDGSGDSERFWSIPWAGRKRVERHIFLVHQGSRGCRTARLGGVPGSQA